MLEKESSLSAPMRYVRARREGEPLSLPTETIPMRPLRIINGDSQQCNEVSTRRKGPYLYRE